MAEHRDAAWMVFTAALAVVPAVSRAAPGDEVTRILPQGCVSGPEGVAFDGRILYFTQLSDPVPAMIYRIEAATGADAGSLVVKVDGIPVDWRPEGLAYDPNRRALWAGTNDLVGISVDTGEVFRSFGVGDSGGIDAVAYDPWTDRIYEDDGTGGNQLHCWQPDGVPCGGLGSTYSHRGLTFDGVDLWHFTPSSLPSPAPAGDGFLFPTRPDIAIIDYARLLDLPGRQYRDIAFDCHTFDVDVVWVANGFGECSIIAFEVDSNAPCPEPGVSVLRATLYDRTSRTDHLPVDGAHADHAWLVATPVDHVDDEFEILYDLDRPLAYYRLSGPGTGDLGNVLRMTEEVARKGVRLVQR